MSAFSVGEGFAGGGADAAHINTILGAKSGPVGSAWATALATPRAGHAAFVVVAAPNIPVKPMTLFVNKATVDPANERHGVLTWGAAQAGVAAGVINAHRKGVLRAEEADDLVLVAAVWVNPAAADEEAVYANNAEAMLAALIAGRDALPSIATVLDVGEPQNPYFRAMTPEQAGHELREAVVRIPGGFMTAASTYARGGELGFSGADFYLSGRAGVLGEVHPDIVVAALVFFAPDLVHEVWARSALVMPHAQAAREVAAVGHAWAAEHLSDDVDWQTVAALLGRVVQAAPVAAAPLFAGWRALEEPEEIKALALHRLNALRELRGALHGAAVLTVGLTAVEAMVVLTPKMLPVFGWPEPYPDAKPLHDRWGLAEARTDRMFGRHLAVLDADERTALVETLAKAVA